MAEDILGVEKDVTLDPAEQKRQEENIKHKRRKGNGNES
jgi:hypothetical protein